MPTGTAIAEPRESLFRAAETVLAREGPGALTTRTVTAEAGVAKGVLHRHFADFDAFLAELALDRAARIEGRAPTLARRAGTGDVVDHVTDALAAALGPLAVSIVGLVVCRDGLRRRLRAAGAARLPLVTEAAAMVSAYLHAEQDRGRIARGADVDALGTAVVGAAHLLLAERGGIPSEDSAPAARSDASEARLALRAVVASALEGALGGAGR